MEFPALMPKELHPYEKMTSEEDLLDLLMKTPVDCIFFFETACADETWSDSHREFLEKMMQWLTEQAFNDRLSAEFCKRIANTIHEHYAIIQDLIPQNMTIQLRDASVQVNSLLFAVVSDFFHDIILSECRDQNKVTLPLNATYEIFAPIEAFTATGKIPDLWKKDRNDVMNLLRQALSWRVNDVAKSCELTLRKYLTLENAIEMLTQAQEEHWPYFKQECIDFINGHFSGFSLAAPKEEHLAFEFHDFSEATLKIFDHLKSLITDLICKGALTEETHFSHIVRLCPKLVLLDISGSFVLSEFLIVIPKDLQGISLAECAWLTSTTLKKIAEICPNIKQMVLSSNFQLNFAAWGELIKFKQLKDLNLSRCHQISDEDLVIILKACGGVTDFVLDECRKIDDRGFFELAKSLLRLTNLSLSHCAISDSALLEIVTRCRSLRVLNLARCEQLTEKGFRELAKHAFVLRELNVKDCNVTQTTIDEMHRIRPFLHINI